MVGKVRNHGDEPADEIGQAHDSGADPGSAAARRFETEFKVHHELNYRQYCMFGLKSCDAGLEGKH